MMDSTSQKSIENPLSQAKASSLSNLSPTVGNVAVPIITETLPSRDPEIVGWEFISRMLVEDILGMPLLGQCNPSAVESKQCFKAVVRFF